MRECVIFDLDGTFAFLGDRSPYDASRAEAMRSTRRSTSSMRQSAWESPRQPCSWYRDARIAGAPETERWLERHGIITDGLFMRRAGDRRMDTVVKREIYERHMQVTTLSASCSTIGIKWCGSGGTIWICPASRSPGAISEDSRRCQVAPTRY